MQDISIKEKSPETGQKRTASGHGLFGRVRFGQSVNHLVGVSTGFHEVDGGSVDLAADFDFERAVRTNGGIAGFLRTACAVGVSFAGHFDFHVVPRHRRQDFAVAEIEGRSIGLPMAAEFAGRCDFLLLFRCGADNLPGILNAPKCRDFTHKDAN